MQKGGAGSDVEGWCRCWCGRLVQKGGVDACTEGLLS